MANAIAQSVTAKISALIDTKFAELQVNLNALSNRIDDNSKRLSEAENRVSENEDRTVSLETKIALLEKKVQDLTTRADDIENRSRRDNIRVIGLKEGTEGNQAVEFFESWLPTTLGIKTKRGVIKIDRAHRSLGERQSNYNRPVIIKLHNSRDKRRILAAAKEKGEIICGNNTVRIRQDFSQSVREARREFNDICEELLEKKIRFRMQYPATLFITLQRLKRSLSLKAIMRSKSVDNFFQRNGQPPPDIIAQQPPIIDERIPTHTDQRPMIITEPCPPSPPPSLDRSPSLSPSLSPNPSLTSHSPSLSNHPSELSFHSPSLSPSLSKAQPTHQKTHCFQEYVFRRPTPCQQCNQIITGNSKQGLRCKSCKMGAHLWCSSELSQQPCNGKSGSFKRNFSSPLLTNTAAKETPASKGGDESRVDPVYEALRYGTSLAQMSRTNFSSISESPVHQGEAEEDRLQNESIIEEENTENHTAASPSNSEKGVSEDRVSLKAPRRIEVHSIHTYVALYKFLPQEKNDLELQPGDRVQVTDDSNEDWWKGKSRDKVGFFPANFVQRVRPGERVWKVTQGYHGNKDRGHMTVKEAQVCVGKGDEMEGFLRVSSGKKRGLVPSNILQEI
ncbi:SH3 and cysteine-rich domain-containing protein 2-like [Engraulis encrasicolus]|uniref:SH3 and cysteine-rich domain-containing protein 2-like n=1 Tax=Engraulis encrasicolus TaxID=184585 RepID=UPI002FD342C2